MGKNVPFSRKGHEPTRAFWIPITRQHSILNLSVRSDTVTQQQTRSRISFGPENGLDGIGRGFESSRRDIRVDPNSALFSIRMWKMAARIEGVH